PFLPYRRGLSGKNTSLLTSSEVSLLTGAWKGAYSLRYPVSRRSPALARAFSFFGARPLFLDSFPLVMAEAAASARLKCFAPNTDSARWKVVFWLDSFSR